MSECRHEQTHTDQPFAFSQAWHVMCGVTCGKILSEGFLSREDAEVAEQDFHEPHRFEVNWRTGGTASNGGVGEYKVSIPNFKGAEVVTAKHHDFIVRSLLRLLSSDRPMRGEERQAVIARAQKSIEPAEVSAA